MNISNVEVKLAYFTNFYFYFKAYKQKFVQLSKDKKFIRSIK